MQTNPNTSPSYSNATRAVLTPARRIAHQIVALILAAALGAYGWHVLTLAFARYLQHATSAHPTMNSVTVFRSFNGNLWNVTDSDFHRPETYEAFIASAGRGTIWGVGDYANAAGLPGKVGWRIINAASTFIAAFFAAGALWILVSHLTRKGQRHAISQCARLVRNHQFQIPTRAILILCALTIASFLFACYLCYPRERIGTGIFLMHDQLPRAALAVGTILGALSASVALRALVATVAMQPIDTPTPPTESAHRPCPRCRHPLSHRPTIGPICNECGLNVDRLHHTSSSGSNILWHLPIRRGLCRAVSLPILAILAVLTLWIARHGNGTSAAARELATRWLTLQPNYRVMPPQVTTP